MEPPDPSPVEQAHSAISADRPSTNTPQASPASAAGKETASCPSPVPWREVVRAFHAESHAWRIDRGRYELEGWTWGNGPPVYFLHGLSATSEMYALFIWLLREQYRCVLLNMPGSRPGAKVRGKLTLDDLATDLFAAADLHDDEKFQVFASSFGCVPTIEALHREPQRVERAVLQGGFAHLTLSTTERLLIQLGHLMPGPLNILIFRRTIQAYNHRRWFPPFDSDRWQFFVDTTGQVPISSIAQRAAIIRDYDGRDALSKIEQPVMLIRSEGEGVVSSICHEELATRLPHAQIEWLHSCGHLPYLSHPHRLAGIVRPFLAGENVAARSESQPSASNVSDTISSAARSSTPANRNLANHERD